MAAAAVVAGMLADPPGGCRQWVVKNHGFKGFVQLPFLVELQEAGNVHVQWTTVLARGKRQILADPSAASMRAQMVLKFMMEMAHGGKHRVRRCLSKSTQRRIANHAA